MTRMPFGRHAGRQLPSIPTPYLSLLRRQMDRHCPLRWVVACEINRRLIAKVT